MKKIKCPLIVSDFDGTLLRSDGTIAPETRRAIAEYIEAGGKFALCTGRMTDSLLLQAKDLGLKGLAAGYQGSSIVDIETGKVLVDGGLLAEEAAEICKLLEEDNLHIHLYLSDGFYSNMDDDALHLYEKITGVCGKVLQKPASEFVLERNEKVKKVLAMVHAKDRSWVYSKAQERLGDKYYITYSSAHLVEILSKNYTKGTAVKLIADYYGIPVENTISVGDCYNDLPLLSAAGRGIAVKNADEELKKVFGAFAYSNDENAIGKIIEEYGFYREEE